MSANEDLEHAMEQLGAAYRKRTEHQSNSHLALKVILIIGGTALAGFAQFQTFPPGASPPFWSLVGMFATVVAGLGGVALAFTEKDTIAELEAARIATDAARELQAQLAQVYYILKNARQATELYLAVRAMRNVIERSFSTPLNEQAAIQACLDASERSLRLAFAFALEDHWTVSVYKADVQRSRRTELACIANLRSVPCDVKNARRWPDGIGVTGIAYARGTEVVIPDLSAKELGSLHDVTALAKKEDGTRYRSVIGVPILIGSNNEKWGIVVATSDQPKHFSLDEQDGIKTTEPARAVAAMIALLLTSHAPPPASATPQPPLQPNPGTT